MCACAMLHNPQRIALCLPQLLVGGAGPRSAHDSDRLAEARQERAQVPASAERAPHHDRLSFSASRVPTVQARSWPARLCSHARGAIQPFARARHRRRFDQIMAASCQIVFVCTFLGAMLVLLFEDMDEYTGVPPGLASELLGFNSSEEVVVMMICVAFTMLVLLGLTLFADSYAHVLQKRLRSKWAVCTLDPPQVKHWPHRAVYACFLSHYKMEAASEARYMHE